jgi:hypothetical protein
VARGLHPRLPQDPAPGFTAPVAMVSVKHDP